MAGHQNAFINLERAAVFLTLRTTDFLEHYSIDNLEDLIKFSKSFFKK